LDAEVLRLRAVVIAVGLLLSACAADAPALPTTAPPTPSSTVQGGSESPSPSIDASPSSRLIPGIALPQPGQPFAAATMFDAMRTSRRPGGVPDQLETNAIAAAVANAIWTYAGEPWTTIATGGSCGAETCTLEVAGTRPNSLGEDLWVFEIVPGTGALTVASANLSALPTEIVDPLDGLARMLFRPGRLDGLALASVRWLPPPSGGEFILSYRSGGEEGSCGADVTLDAVLPEIVEDRLVGC
jgi:hypothetical protein